MLLADYNFSIGGSSLIPPVGNGVQSGQLEKPGQLKNPK